MKHFVVLNSSDLTAGDWGLSGGFLAFSKSSSDEAKPKLSRSKLDEVKWAYDLIVSSPGSVSEEANGDDWKVRCGEIGDYVVWHHFGGTNSEDVQSAEIEKKWAEFQSCLDNINLMREGDDPCFFPFSMDSSCSRRWDRACQELSDVIRTTLIDRGALKRALESLDEAVPLAISHFLGRPAEVLDQVFPVILAIREGLGIEEARQFLPDDVKAKAKLSKSLQRWQNPNYWMGMKFDAARNEGEQWIPYTSEFAKTFLKFMENEETIESTEREMMLGKFEYVSQLIRETRGPG